MLGRPVATGKEPRFHLPEATAIHRLTMDDGCEVRAMFLRAEQPRGNLLLLTGRADFLEKWATSYRRFHAMGLNLVSFDWRGQGASDREVFNRAGFIRSYDRWLHDLDIIANWTSKTFVNDLPCFVLGHSMGGHLLARWLSDPERASHSLRQRLSGAVLVSPFIDLPFLTRLVVRLPAFICQKTGYAWWQGPYDTADNSVSRQRKLTFSAEQFEDELRWVIKNPELATGGATWGWLRAFFKSRKILHRASFEKRAFPMLLLAGSEEKIVSLKAIKAFAQRVPDIDFQLFSGGAHELLREAEPVGSTVYRAIEEFMFGHKSD